MAEYTTISYIQVAGETDLEVEPIFKELMKVTTINIKEDNWQHM